MPPNRYDPSVSSPFRKFRFPDTYDPFSVRYDQRDCVPAGSRRLFAGSPTAALRGERQKGGTDIMRTFLTPRRAGGEPSPHVARTEDDTNYGGTSAMDDVSTCLAEAFQKRFFYGGRTTSAQKWFRKEDHGAVDDHARPKEDHGADHAEKHHLLTQNEEDFHQHPATKKIADVLAAIHAEKKYDEEYGHPLTPHPHVTAVAAAKYKKLYLEWHKTAGTRGQERDAAVGERDAAIAERGTAIGERDAAIAERDAAIRERDVAIAERDAAVGETRPNDRRQELVADLEELRDESVRRSDAAIAERDAAMSERDAAISERDAAIASARDSAFAKHSSDAEVSQLTETLQVGSRSPN